MSQIEWEELPGMETKNGANPFLSWSLGLSHYNNLKIRSHDKWLQEEK